MAKPKNVSETQVEQVEQVEQVGTKKAYRPTRRLTTKELFGGKNGPADIKWVHGSDKMLLGTMSLNVSDIKTVTTAFGTSCCFIGSHIGEARDGTLLSSRQAYVPGALGEMLEDTCKDADFDSGEIVSAVFEIYVVGSSKSTAESPKYEYLVIPVGEISPPENAAFAALMDAKSKQLALPE